MRKIIKQVSITPNVSQTDPLGSYTGVPADLWDTPEQDADDL